MLREGPAQRPTVHIHPSTYAILKCFPPTLVKELNLFREMISAFKIIVKSNSKSFCSREEEKNYLRHKLSAFNLCLSISFDPFGNKLASQGICIRWVKKVRHDSRSRMVILINQTSCPLLHSLTRPSKMNVAL